MEKQTSYQKNAAAWAWYLHGGGRESRGATATATVHRAGGGKSRASRFQAEARQRLEQELQEKQRIASYSDLLKLQWDCGSVLFDSYELVALSAQLDRGLMSAGPLSLLTPLSLNDSDDKNVNQRLAKAEGLSSDFDDIQEQNLQAQSCLPIPKRFVKRKSIISWKRRRSLLSRASELFCTSPQRHHHHFHYHHHFHHRQ